MAADAIAIGLWFSLREIGRLLREEDNLNTAGAILESIGSLYLGTLLPIEGDDLSSTSQTYFYNFLFTAAV